MKSFRSIRYPSFRGQIPNIMVQNSILGYELGQDIGQGGQAKVRLAYNPITNHQVAIKIIEKNPSNSPQKEFKIHASVSHQNIIKLFNGSEDHHYMYFVLEFAQAGELFDKIEPDVGIDEEIAHFYFHQLLAAMEYLHLNGICHRDLKPENILLDESGNLKLSDFGLATVFKHKGKTRILTTPCGTPPYLAPEIRSLSYRGDKVDIWSAGIILYVMLVGNTPWAEPTQVDEEFVMYCKHYQTGLDFYPWNSFSPLVLVVFINKELLRGILNIDPDGRYQVNQIHDSEWYSL